MDADAGRVQREAWGWEVIVVGIDLGVTGAVTALGPQCASVHDLPIIEDERGKRLDAPKFVALLRQLIPASEAGLLAAENVHVQQVQGRTMSHSTETTLVGLRFAVQAVADCMRFPLVLVTPQSWKKHYGIKADKTGKQAREIAARMYPGLALQLARVKDHNRAESVLIAHYARGKAT